MKVIDLSERLSDGSRSKSSGCDSEEESIGFSTYRYLVDLLSLLSLLHVRLIISITYVAAMALNNSRLLLAFLCTFSLLCTQSLASFLPQAAHGYLAPRSNPNHFPNFNPRQVSGTNATIPDRVLNATQSDIDNARAIVNAAIAQAAVLNKARVENPMRNNYKLQPGTIVSKRDDMVNDTAPPPLLNITPEIADAAALLAEVDALATINSTRTVQKRGTGLSYWMEVLDRKGTVPFGNNATYQVNILISF
jgi:flavin-binding protein dodecin